MGFLRAAAFADQATLRAPGIVLRAPASGDFDAWVDLRRQSRDFLAPWEPIWPDDDLSRPSYRRRLRRWAEESRGGLTFPWFLFDEIDGRLLGGLTLAQVRRGVTQTGTIGYWMGAPHAGRGLMTGAVLALARHAFRDLRLHRLEAACLPDNEPSIRLLRKVGFTREGYARAYLHIAGEWRDHLLWGLLETDPLLPAVPAAERPACPRAPVGIDG
ncbi:MAG: GNAT family protein [Siculibacillus sp.]